MTAHRTDEALDDLRAHNRGELHGPLLLHGAEVTVGRAKLEDQPEKLWSLNEMENTGGEPDVVGRDPKNGEYIFYDCSPESPKRKI